MLIRAYVAVDDGPEVGVFVLAGADVDSGFQQGALESRTI